MDLIILPDSLSVCRLAPDSPIPPWATAGSFYAIVRSPDELSVVCPDGLPPAGTQREGPWRALKVQGPLDFEETGILADLTVPLAAAGVSVFAVSSFDTDYLLIRETSLSIALRVLRPVHTIHHSS